MRGSARRRSGRPAGTSRGPFLPPVPPGPPDPGLRVLSGRPPQRWLRRPGHRVTLIAADTDAEGGVAAVWVIRRWPKHPPTSEVWQYERGPGGWRWTGGSSGTAPEKMLASRPSAARSGPASMLTEHSSQGGRRHAGLEDGTPASLAAAAWAGCDTFRVAAEVASVRAGDRQIAVPDHGYVIVAWTGPAASRSTARPPIAAVGRDGSALTVLAPGGHLASLEDAAARPADEDPAR